ncbi:hypothetical protein [Acetivibrio mesophilus]|uniref:hypothetical protein n=1 Tax=Acetivibrio mesophilus TaxID=2487273 RepID=UPI000AAE9DD8|nr:hypothetical protein [Acetivibrio mesophilus]HHV28735.1 hypothetical protein [Clostridium sp.]
MNGYSFTEIGMLVGAAVGGILSVIGFVFWHSTATFAFAFIGIALGILTGNIIDKRFIE